MESKVLNLEGKELRTITLKESMFNVEFNNVLFKEVVQYHQSNSRAGLAKTKARWEMNWSTKKVRKQKGSGRSRAGSRGMPHWKGGYVVFGPTGRDYSYTIPKTKKRKALLMCLTNKLQEKQLIIVDSLDVEKPNTKHFLKICENLNINEHALFVDCDKNDNFYFSMRNVIKFNFLPLMGLNVLSLAKANQLVITENALKSLEEKYEI